MSQVETLVTCPSCDCMGHHPFETYNFRPRYLPAADGELVLVSSYSDPPEGTPMIGRSCVFCGHRWARVAP